MQIDDADVGSFESRERRQKKRKLTKDLKQPDKAHSDDGSDTEASRGTQDSFMAELKAKNEGTYKWEDVNTQKSPTPSDSEEELFQSMAELERQRRKSKTNASRSPRSPVSTSPARKSSRLGFTENQNAPVLPLWMAKPSVNSLKRSKRKPGEADQAAPANADERRRKSLSLTRQNTWKKKRGEEPVPDAGAIMMFRPGDVLTAGGRTMKSGRGVGKSVGDIDAAISFTQEQPSPTIKKRMSFGEKFPEDVSKQPDSSGSKSFTEALADAWKTLAEPSPPLNHGSRPVGDIDKDGMGTAWRGPSPVSSSATVPVQTLASIPPSASSATRAPPPHRMQNETRQSASGDSVPASRPPPPPGRVSSLTTPRTPSDDGSSTTNIVPTLTEDSSRTWTGELLYSTELKSLGSIRLHVPESSTRIQRVPNFSKSVLCLQKLVTARYVTQKWLSASAHPTNKPECLSVQFQNSQSQSTLVEILKSTESVGLVIDEACTLLFFFKYNDRLRGIFIGDSTSEPIGVALLQPLELSNSLNDNSPADEVQPFRFLMLTVSFSRNGKCRTEVCSYPKRSIRSFRS